MVGIAAGVPNPEVPSKHVRLGDVVVATWGVVDYDHVDERVGGRDLRGGFPRLSSWLSAAAKRLEAGELQDERPWERWLDISQHPELKSYLRPPADTDVLRAGDESGRVLEHPDPATSGHRPGLPKVHYGRIGTANRSLRNATVRDDVAAKYDLRAFEMEASGIGTGTYLAGLDCFVVRGISDYGDSRTEPTWRAYAALAAAAYVRALLAESPARTPRGGHPSSGPVVDDRKADDEVAPVAPNRSGRAGGSRSQSSS